MDLDITFSFLSLSLSLAIVHAILDSALIFVLSVDKVRRVGRLNRVRSRREVIAVNVYCMTLGWTEKENRFKVHEKGRIVIYAISPRHRRRRLKSTEERLRVSFISLTDLLLRQRSFSLLFITR